MCAGKFLHIIKIIHESENDCSAMKVNQLNDEIMSDDMSQCNVINYNI